MHEDDSPAGPDGMDHWWDDVDGAVLGCLAERGSMSPGELCGHLGMSERAVVSLLCLLASEGRIRICLVEHVDATARDRARRVA